MLKKYLDPLVSRSQHPNDVYYAQVQSGVLCLVKERVVTELGLQHRHKARHVEVIEADILQVYSC